MDRKRKVNNLIINILLLGIVIVCFACENSIRYEYYFQSKNNSSDLRIDTIISHSSIIITRLIKKPSYTLSSDIWRNESSKKRYLDSINLTNKLEIYFQTALFIEKSFKIDSLEVKVFRIQNQRNRDKIALIGVYLSDLETFYNSYDYIGKDFSDFPSISVNKGTKKNNILMSSTYDISNIEDTVFLVSTNFALRTQNSIIKSSFSDTIVQYRVLEKVLPISVH